MKNLKWQLDETKMCNLTYNKQIDTAIYWWFMD